MLLKLFCVLLMGLSQYCAAAGVEEGNRVKRGASVYPVFGGANSAGMGAEQNSYLFLHDATPFIQYLGGGGGRSAHSGGGQSSSYSFRVRAPPGGGGSYALESNGLNSYNLHSSTQPAPPSPTPSYSGWQASASGYAGGHYVPYFGLIMPNFASTGQSPSTHRAPAPRHDLPTLDASSLLHSAQSSFNAQTAVFNALTGGSRPRSYKGGY